MNATETGKPEKGRPVWAAAFLLSPSVFFVGLFLHRCLFYRRGPSGGSGTPVLVDQYLLEAAGASAVACFVLFLLIFLARQLAVRFRRGAEAARCIAPYLVRGSMALVISVAGVYFWALGLRTYEYTREGRFSTLAGWPYRFVDHAPHGGPYWMRWHMVYDTVAWFVLILAFYYFLPAVVKGVIGHFRNAAAARLILKEIRADAPESREKE